MKKMLYIFVLAMILGFGGIVNAAASEADRLPINTRVSHALPAPQSPGSKTAAVHGSCGEQADWDLDTQGTLTISGTGPMYNYYGGTPWNALRDNIKKIVIQEGITSIGYQSFDACTNVKTIVLPTSLTSMGEYALNDCKSLQSITIPKQLKTIEYGAFHGCTALTELNYLAVDCAINNNWYEPVFPDSRALETVTLGSEVRVLPRYLLSGCTRIKSIAIPAMVEEIGENVFQGCAALTTVYYHAAGNAQSYSGTAIFEGCTSLTQIVLGPTVKHIPASLFRYCSYLKTLTIPENIESIERSAFTDCTGLTEVYYNAANCSLARSANIFENCSQLTKCMIGPAVKTLPGIFAGCSQIRQIAIPYGVEVLDDYAFANCSGLTDITIPDSVHTLGDYVFQDCTSLKQIYLPASVTKIGYRIVSSNENFELILGENGSYAADYAVQNGLHFMEDAFYRQWKGKGSVISLYGSQSARPNQYVNKNVSMIVQDRIQFLCLTLRYRTNCFTLQHSLEIDFRGSIKTTIVPDTDGYEKVTISAQYNSENGSWTADSPCTPIGLRFRVVPEAPVKPTNIEIVSAESYAITPDKRQIFFDGVLDDPVELLPQPAYSVSISGPDRISVPVSYQVDFNPYYTTDKRVKWKVGNPQIAEITQEGRLRPKQNGNTFLSVRTLDGSGKEAFFNFTVENLLTPVQAIQLSISGNEKVTGMEQYTALFEPETVTNQLVKWSLDDETVAKIDQTGTLHPLKNGSVRITATATDGSGISADRQVQIQELPASVNEMGSDTGTWYPAFHPAQYEYEIKLPTGQTGLSLHASFAEGTLTCAEKPITSGVLFPVSMDGRTEKEIDLEYQKPGFSKAVYHLTIRQGQDDKSLQTIAFQRTDTGDHTFGFDLYRLDDQHPDAAVFLAVYDREGTMLDMKTCLMGTDQLYRDRIALDTLKDDPKIYKLMIWDSTGGMRPISEGEMGQLYE